MRALRRPIISFDFQQGKKEKEVSNGDYIVAKVYGNWCIKKIVAIVDDINEERYVYISKVPKEKYCFK